jgi:hypothetical protein
MCFSQENSREIPKHRIGAEADFHWKDEFDERWKQPAIDFQNERNIAQIR